MYNMYGTLPIIMINLMTSYMRNNKLINNIQTQLKFFITINGHCVLHLTFVFGQQFLSH